MPLRTAGAREYYEIFLFNLEILKLQIFFLSVQDCDEATEGLPLEPGIVDY